MRQGFMHRVPFRLFALPAVFVSAGLLLHTSDSQAQSAMQRSTPSPVHTPPGMLANQAPPSVGAQEQEAPPREQTATITAVARTVLLDVTVVDAQGQPVKGLTQADFNVQEDGNPQKVNSFHEHDAVDAAAAAAQVQRLKLPVNGYANYMPITTGDALTVILLDAGSMTPGVQAMARQALIAYMKTVPPGHPIAIFQMDTSMHLLQSFSSDPEVLLAAAESKRDEIRVGNAPLHEPGFVGYEFRSDNMHEGMLTMARYLAGFPGRKNLIWFTGGIPGSHYGISSPFPQIEDFQEELTSASETLALSRVSVFPVDARGLEIDPAMTASHSGIPSPMSGARFDNRRFDDHAVMAQMADETGGHAYYNTNGLKDVIRTVVETGSFYYTLAYTPTNKNWNGSYRKIHIDLPSSMSTYHLQYRTGYNARPPSDAQARRAVRRKLQTTQTAWIPPPATAAGPHHLAAAMQLGAIPPTEMMFSVSVSPGTQVQKLEKGTAPPPGNFMRENERGKPFRQFHLVYVLSPASLKFTKSPDGVEQGELEFIALVYNDKGEQLNSAMNTLQMDLKPDTYAKVMKIGMGMRQDISVPDKGNYFLRLGVHDTANDRVGTIEIPVDSVHLGTPGPGQTLMP